MMTRTLAAALAALLLCGAARAETDDEGGPLGEPPPARVQVSTGAATETGGARAFQGPADAPPSAGAGRTGSSKSAPASGTALNVVPTEGVYGSDGNPQAHADVPLRPPVKYPSYKSAPHDRRITAQLYMDFNAGPGTVISVGFKGPTQPGGWEWVEHLDGTTQCAYSAWASEQPAGPTAGPNCGVHSGVIGDLWFGPEIRNQVERETLCKLSPGRQYYMNLRLDSWEANHAAHDLKACVEYLKTNGLGGFEIMAQ